jgi:hypothetical protein
MLQVARLAPKQLGESRDLVASFLHSRLNRDGGFQNRAGESDLYYTVFGLEGLIALQESVPTEAVASYLRQFGDGGGLDFVHLACLARCWAAIAKDLSGVPVPRIIERVESHRANDGGYGNVYNAFLALGAYQDLRMRVPDPDRLVNALPREPQDITPVTAALVMLLKTLGEPLDPHLRLWLLDRCHSSGGFVAAPEAPVPDLLSTATALHALAALHAPLSGLYEACLDFIDSLWSNRGGFFGTWLDDVVDCEYTYYGLLALGHLTVAAPDARL